MVVAKRKATYKQQVGAQNWLRNEVNKANPLAGKGL